MEGVVTTKIDARLTLTFDDETEKWGIDAERIMLPMLVQTIDEDWDYSGVPAFLYLGHIGNIFSGFGNIKTIAALEADEQVVSVEASPTVGWDYGIDSGGEV